MPEKLQMYKMKIIITHLSAKSAAVVQPSTKIGQIQLPTASAAPSLCCCSTDSKAPSLPVLRKRRGTAHRKTQAMVVKFFSAELSAGNLVLDSAKGVFCMPNGVPLPFCASSREFVPYAIEKLKSCDLHAQRVQAPCQNLSSIRPA